MLTRIPFAQADARFRLRELLPAFDPRQDVVVLAAGSYPAEQLDLDRWSYVVDGDLAIDGDVWATEEGRFLVVRGDLRVRNLLIGGPVIHVGGALVVEHGLHADYNHGELTVCGDARAAVVIAEHMVRIGGRLDAETTIDLGGLHVAAPGFVPTLTRDQALAEAATLFVPDALDEDGHLRGSALAAVLADGAHPLRSPR